VIRAAVTTLGVLCALGCSSNAFAQSEPASRLELGVGVRWIGTEQLGAKSATETTGSGGRSTLFSTTSELAGAAGIEGRVGVRLSRALLVEAEGAYLKPELRIAISADAEGAAPVTATEAIQQFTIGGDVVWYLPVHRWSPAWRRSRSAAPDTCGSSTIRATLVDTGGFYHVGGGVSMLFTSGGRWHTKGRRRARRRAGVHPLERRGVR
jgi:hypothetical protein